MFETVMTTSNTKAIAKSDRAIDAPRPSKPLAFEYHDDGHESVALAQRVAAMVISGDYTDQEIEALLACHT